MSKPMPRQQYLNSTCTFHLTPNRSIFKTFNTIVVRPIEFAGDTDIKSAGIGTIHATLLKSTNGAKLRLKNVLYVPGLSTNLISASKLNKSEIKTYSKLGGKVDILPGDRTLE
ncbi:uncharacterized protein RSE6_13470 [Rhynchosporium secalis]|uniref:Retrovirus-related Pol polyprotein from transposon TNT 1-94-like beta-barrel domain-containing protein n=1 Tax=Rhynchosporium secalis TaxID=38038 RepID=A0A1E1MSY5_RHYSE|nr:uncharacterized protein RSE6_13470 [Rhynchosporium secalis]